MVDAGYWSLLVVPAIVPSFYTQALCVCDVLVSAAGQTTYKLVILKLSFVSHTYMEEARENYVFIWELLHNKNRLCGFTDAYAFIICL